MECKADLSEMGAAGMHQHSCMIMGFMMTLIIGGHQLLE